jgi:hypothetical protein
MFFRPEEQHSFSGKDNIIPPMVCWHRKMDNASIAGNFSVDNFYLECTTAICAGGLNVDILVEHRRNAK